MSFRADGAVLYISESVVGSSMAGGPTPRIAMVRASDLRTRVGLQLGAAAISGLRMVKIPVPG